MCVLSPCACHSSVPHFTSLSLSHIYTHSLFKACPLCNSSVKEMRLHIISEQAQNAGSRQANALGKEPFQVLFNSQVSSEETVCHYFTSRLITSLLHYPQIFILMKQPGGSIPQCPLTNQETLQAFLLSISISKHLTRHSRGLTDITTTPLPKSTLGSQSEKSLLTKALELIQVPATSLPPCPSNLLSASLALLLLPHLPLIVMTSQTNQPHGSWSLEQSTQQS